MAGFRAEHERNECPPMEELERPFVQLPLLVLDPKKLRQRVPVLQGVPVDAVQLLRIQLGSQAFDILRSARVEIENGGPEDFPVFADRDNGFSERRHGKRLHGVLCRFPGSLGNHSLNLGPYFMRIKLGPAGSCAPYIVFLIGKGEEPALRGESGGLATRGSYVDAEKAHERIVRAIPEILK